jgi:hypothetical protein
MARSLTIMLPNGYYLRDVDGGFAWTRQEDSAKRFDSPAALQAFVDRHLDGDIVMARISGAAA